MRESKDYKLDFYASKTGKRYYVDVVSSDDSNISYLCLGAGDTKIDALNDASEELNAMFRSLANEFAEQEW